MVDKDKISALLDTATAADGQEPLSEQFLLGLEDKRLGHRHETWELDGQVVGLIAADGDVAEMVVHPGHRQEGIGTSLYHKLAPAQVWAHGNLEPARHFAQSLNLEEQRRLVVMEIAGTQLDRAAAQPVTELAVLDYLHSTQQFGKEFVDQAWLDTNNEAFSWHPEQGGWDLARLHRGMEATWFDPADVIFLWDTASATPGLAGFHWTKWHGKDPGRGENVGEVYVVGLAHAYRGQGLGQPLLSAGLKRMVDKGADSVILYVESTNQPALKAYNQLGFSTREVHSLYGRQEDS